MSALGPRPRSRPRCPPFGASCAGVLFGARTFAKGFSRGDHPRAQGRLGMDQTLWAIFDRNCGVEEEKDWDLVKGLQVVKE